MNDRAFCEAMLPRVSRTFALCIRLLPPDLEYPILVAYLLCRIADTIEDTPDLGGALKQELLEHFANWLSEPAAGPEPLRDMFARRATSEELLAYHGDVVMREFRQLPERQQQCIAPWVREMATGMADFAVKSGPPGSGMHALSSLAELERYCYYVAGTVGHMLTALYPTGSGTIPEETVERLDRLAASFGLGLQMTNIIKDVADDRERGWSYVPRDLCDAVGIRPEQLHDPVYRGPAREVMLLLVTEAARHLDDARDYCTTLPRGVYRVRLFCLTSMFFAVRTLALARHTHRLLDPDWKLKISRADVYRTLGAAACVAPSNALIRRYYRALSQPSRQAAP